MGSKPVDKVAEQAPVAFKTSSWVPELNAGEQKNSNQPKFAEIVKSPQEVKF
jgi:hypothetical protein